MKELAILYIYQWLIEPLHNTKILSDVVTLVDVKDCQQGLLWECTSYYVCFQYSGLSSYPIVTTAILRCRMNQERLDELLGQV